MPSSRKTKILNLVCVALVMLAGAVRLLGYHYGTFSYNGIICVCFTASAFIWMYQIQRRLIQPDVRRNLTVCALMIILWMFLRTIKYEFLPAGHITERYAWYLYYIPQTFCVLLMFFSVLHIGRPQNRPISRRWKLLYIPAAVISFGILTNDLHQLAFSFPYGLENYDSSGYSHGPFYYASVLWVAILFTAILVTVFSRCAVPDKRRKLRLPMLPLILGIIYFISYLLNQDGFLVTTFKMPEFISVIFASFMECLILTHLIPSNDSYGDFWNASSIGAGIMDRNGVIRYKSERSVSVTEEQVYEAEKQVILLENGSVLLRSHAIHGGFGYWTKDISEINKLNRELSELGDVLAEENAMLDAENKLAEERVRIEQQNKLYDDIAKKVKPQLDKLSELVDMPVQSEEGFEQAMKYACILNAYIKRISNMLLLFHQNNRVFSGELCLAISESLEYVRLNEVKAHFEYRGEGSLSGECILLIYEVFESALEVSIPGSDAVLVNLDILRDYINLRIEINAPGKTLPQSIMAERINALGGTLETEIEQQTEYISLILPSGGEGV
ncbi:MAG: histidine kinase N-terminal 7TM domain-containing protein [Acutalibacteraceae bacterium]